MGKKIASKTICFAVAAALLISGCSGGKNFDDAYSFESRRDNWSISQEEIGYADGFAKDLCVVFDEGQYREGLVDAEAAAVFGVDDCSVIYSKNAFERLYPASITKVMTAILAIEEGELSDRVAVTEDAVITEAGASLCGIKPGDTLTMEQLLYGLMMPSGNDAANAIAVHMSGSLEAFNERMNEKARSLGATQTHFMNASGLNDEDHYTTAYDLYLIFNEALKLPLFRQIIGTTAYTADYVNQKGEPVSKTWTVGNWYLNGERKAPQGLTVLGGKTGTTQAAGYCLIMASRDTDEKEYISVVLKAGSRQNLYDNMTNIITKVVN